VDVFVTTWDEPVELVRRSVRDAKRSATHPLALASRARRRTPPAMRAMAEDEGVCYLTRPTNDGFKAGNLRNGLERTDGDLFVICDADTRPLPALLEETLGYFRDPRVAWVQTPQWFYDVARGTPLPEWLAGGPARPRRRAIGRAVGASSAPWRSARIRSAPIRAPSTTSCSAGGTGATPRSAAARGASTGARR
jgi:cellulose synthase (UDP-forming)